MGAVFLPLFMLVILLLIAELGVSRYPAHGFLAENVWLAPLASIAILSIAFLFAYRTLNRRLQPIRDRLLTRQHEFDRRTAALHDSPIPLLRFGRDGRIRSLNSSACRLLGLDTMPDPIDLISSCLPSDSRSPFEHQLAIAIETGIGSCEIELRRPDGTFIPATAAFVLLSPPCGDQEEQEDTVAVILKDLSAMRPLASDQPNKVKERADSVSATKETIRDLPDRARADERPAENARSSPSQGSVLLIEDHEISRMIASKMLNSFQCVVYEAENANQAYELLMEIGSRLDLVLMDLHMPGIDGVQAVRTIRSMERFRNLPIVIQTADTSLDQHMSCLEAGANEVMTKPIELKHLKQLLERWIGVVPTESPSSPNRGRSVALDPELQLEGLNAIEALERVDGRLSFYLSMLTRFQERYRDLIPFLHRSLEGGERSEVIRILHTFRGAASHLSAFGVYEAATLLEESLKLSDTNDPKLLDELGRQLDIVFRSIDKYKESISVANISDTGGDLH